MMLWGLSPSYPIKHLSVRCIGVRIRGREKQGLQCEHRTLEDTACHFIMSQCVSLCERIYESVSVSQPFHALCGTGHVKKTKRDSLQSRLQWVQTANWMRSDPQHHITWVKTLDLFIHWIIPSLPLPSLSLPSLAKPCLAFLSIPFPSVTSPFEDISKALVARRDTLTQPFFYTVPVILGWRLGLNQGHVFVVSLFCLVFLRFCGVSQFDNCLRF